MKASVASGCSRILGIDFAKGRPGFSAIYVGSCSCIIVVFIDFVGWDDLNSGKATIARKWWLGLGRTIFATAISINSSGRNLIQGMDGILLEVELLKRHFGKRLPSATISVAKQRTNKNPLLPPKRPFFVG